MYVVHTHLQWWLIGKCVSPVFLKQWAWTELLIWHSSRTYNVRLNLPVCRCWDLSAWWGTLFNPVYCSHIWVMSRLCFLRKQFKGQKKKKANKLSLWSNVLKAGVSILTWKCFKEAGLQDSDEHSVGFPGWVFTVITNECLNEHMVVCLWRCCDQVNWVRLQAVRLLAPCS